jgi:Acyl-CoA reductase (LuxC)
MEQRFPAGPDVEAPALLEEIGVAPEGGPLAVGDPRVVDFLAAFARRLLTPGGVRRFPELASLGFFLRRAEINRALDTLRSDASGVRFPRGLVFHVPPANVDTIFVYSWALSALAGNRNVVRISPRAAGAAARALEALNEALADSHPAVGRTQRMVTYGHDEAATAALSAACNLRVVWGGDRSVTEVRRHPLAPRARDLTFPDRTSFAAISVDGWRQASEAVRREAARGFFNDAYWFDQAACASPRALFWVGDGDEAVKASREFFAHLRGVLDAGAYITEPAMAVQKRVAAYGAAADGLVRSIRLLGNEIAVLDLVEAATLPSGWLGAGTFLQATVPGPEALAAVVGPKDQTCSYFGFGRPELGQLVLGLGGRGVDRLVPFGSALSFSAVWDGYDLLTELTRVTTLEPPAPPAQDHRGAGAGRTEG